MTNLTQVFWLIIPHSHGTKNMNYIATSKLGDLYACRKCGRLDIL